MAHPEPTIEDIEAAAEAQALAEAVSVVEKLAVSSVASMRLTDRLDLAL
jgi:hypothetical protein